MKNLVSKLGNGAKALGTNLRGYAGRGAEYLIDRLPKGAKRAGIVGLTALSLAGGYGATKADAIPILSFYDLIPPGGSSQWTEMNIDYVNQTADNLMIRDSNGVDSVVEKDGSVWRMGFLKNVPGGWVIGGYANNDNNYSNNDPGFEGWLQGLYKNNVFPNGTAMDDVILIHDGLGDGMGNLDGGVWTLDSNDTIYGSNSILFNGIRGPAGIPEMPIPDYIGGKTLYLPKLTVAPIPEPGTMALLGIGLAGGAALARRKQKAIEDRNKLFKKAGILD